MDNNCAVIVIDTGFSQEALSLVRNLVAVADLTTGTAIEGAPYLDPENEQVRRFAGDPLNHGSLVLKALLAANEELPVVLVRAYTDEVRLIRTLFQDGRISRQGFTEAYLWAVDVCSKRGLSTVTNCSFGGYTHAMDGSGWEAFCLGKVSGKDKPGHIVVAGAGSGDGRALRASLAVRPGSSESVVCNQSETTTYNFWCRALSDSPLSQGWHIEVLKGDSVVFAQSGHQVPGNLWNGRQQSTFAIHGAGQVVFRVSRDHCDDSEPTWFDCYINHQDDAVFLDHINLSTVAEPAVFPGVLAVGLVKGSYSPDQEQAGAKPDVLIAGNGPISFRLPELVARVAEWLSSDPLLDVAKVKQRLGKFPSF